jgi:hypothetical protein
LEDRRQKTDDDCEIVVDIEGFPNYKVSSLGYVRSTVRGIALSPYVDARGRQSVQLYRGGVPHKRYVHRLVAEAFLPEGKNHWQNEVAHIDGDLSNNAAKNLIWVSHWEFSYIYDRPLGREHPAVLDETTGEVFSTYSEAARSINGNRNAVYYCCIGIQEEHKGHRFTYIE